MSESVRHCSGSAGFWKGSLEADEWAMGGAGTTGRGVPPTGVGGVAEPAPDDERDPVASSERSKVAGGAGGAGTLVEGRPDVYPLIQAGRMGAASALGAK